MNIGNETKAFILPDEGAEMAQFITHTVGHEQSFEPVMQFVCTISSAPHLDGVTVIAWMDSNQHVIMTVGVITDLNRLNAMRGSFSELHEAVSVAYANFDERMEEQGISTYLTYINHQTADVAGLFPTLRAALADDPLMANLGSHDQLLVFTVGSPTNNFLS